MSALAPHALLCFLKSNMASASAGASFQGGYFAVDVKRDCPHLKDSFQNDVTVDIKAKCQDCENIGENWVCLTCSKVYCSRYVNEHMVAHNTNEKHPVALSFSDASVWCYICDSYIDHPVLKAICKTVAHAKTC